MQTDSVSRLGSVKGGVMGLQAEGVYQQRECADRGSVQGEEHTETRVHMGIMMG